MKATKQNYRLLCETMYNFTGMVYWLHKLEFDRQMKENFFVCFADVKKQVFEKVNSGCTLQFPLIVNGNEKPYIYNSLNLGTNKKKYKVVAWDADTKYPCSFELI